MVVVSLFLAFPVKVAYSVACTEELEHAAVESLAAMPFVDVDTRDGPDNSANIHSMPVLAVLSVEIVGDPLLSPHGEDFCVKAAVLAQVLCVDVRRFDVALLRATEITSGVLTAEGGPVAGYLSTLVSANPVVAPGYAFEYAFNPVNNTWHTEAYRLDHEEGAGGWQPASSTGHPNPCVAVGSALLVDVMRFVQTEGKPLSCTFGMNKEGLGLVQAVLLPPEEEACPEAVLSQRFHGSREGSPE